MLSLSPIDTAVAVLGRQAGHGRVLDPAAAEVEDQQPVLVLQEDFKNQKQLRLGGQKLWALPVVSPPLKAAMPYKKAFRLGKTI